MDGGAGFEELFAHQEWVRVLASRLCASEGEADELAQEAWLIALGSGARAREPRAWLGGVLRHLARRARRGERARAERERLAARSESVPSADELASRAELQRRVLAAVATLDERSRTVVLLRWYEGLGGEEIARRLGLSGSTVRNRLSRAHEKLRGSLDREYGGRASWAVLFAPLGTPLVTWGSGAQAAAGMGIMMKLQLALGAVALAAAALWLWPRPGGVGGRPAGALELPSALAAPSAAEAPASAEHAAPTRAEPALSASRVDAAEQVEHVLVWGELTGAGEQKLEGSLAFLDEAGSSHAATLGARASYSVFGLAPGRYRVLAWLDGCLPLSEELVLGPFEEKVRHDLALERALALPVRIIERESSELLTSSFQESKRSGLGVVATRERPLSIGGVESLEVGARGLGRYLPASGLDRPAALPPGASGLLELRARPPFFASLVLRSVVLESRVVTGAEEELVFELGRGDLEALLGSLLLRCVAAESGRPVVGAKVSVSYADFHGGGADTDGEGRVELTELTPGRRRLSIQAKERASVQRWIEIEPGGRLELGDVPLLPLARIAGRVLDPAGRGVRAKLHTLVPKRFADEGILRMLWPRESDAEGSFLIDGSGAERQRLVARAEGWALAVQDLDASSGAVEGLELRLERGTQVVLWPEPGMLESVSVVLADALGAPILSEWVHPLGARRWTLARGRYELRTMLGSEVVRVHLFDVGEEPLALEVSAPR